MRLLPSLGAAGTAGLLEGVSLPSPPSGPPSLLPTWPLGSRAASPLGPCVRFIGSQRAERGHTRPITVCPQPCPEPPCPGLVSSSKGPQPEGNPGEGLWGLPSLTLRDPAPGSLTARPHPIQYLLRQVGQALPQAVQADDGGGVVVPGAQRGPGSVGAVRQCLDLPQPWLIGVGAGLWGGAPAGSWGQVDGSGGRALGPAWSPGTGSRLEPSALL